MHLIYTEQVYNPIPSKYGTWQDTSMPVKHMRESLKIQGRVR
jgi:hypothetical protein